MSTATVAAPAPARTWQQVLDDLAEAIERRRAVDLDVRTYLDEFYDEHERPTVEFSVFREAEIERLDTEIETLIVEAQQVGAA